MASAATSGAARSGFSLIELIVVVAIIAITAAGLVYTIQNQSLGNLNTDAQGIADRLAEAQSRAINAVDGVGWGVRFDNTTPGSPKYSIFAGSSFSSAWSTYYLSNVVEFTTPASGATLDVAFKKRTGRVTSTSTIVIDLRTSTSTQKTITVSPNGNITVQ